MRATSTEHRFFDPLVAFLCNHIGVSLSLIAHRRGTWRAIEPDKFGGIAAVASGIELWYNIRSILDPVERGDWPTTIELVEQPLTLAENLPTETVHRTDRIHVLSSLAMFIQYFDSVEDLAARQQSNDVVRFAKSVRNFAAHGGEIRGLDARARPLRWQSIEWTAADNGRPLLSGDVEGQAGMSRGDLILLMRDLDAVL
jgi:hypothetical protein